MEGSAGFSLRCNPAYPMRHRYVASRACLMRACTGDPMNAIYDSDFYAWTQKIAKQYGSPPRKIVLNMTAVVT